MESEHLMTGEATSAAPVRRTRWGPTMWPQAMLLWPRRRWVAAGVLIPATTAGFLGMAVRPAAGVAFPLWGWPVGLLAAVLAALTLGSYVAGPGEGRRIHVGCSPCALVSAASVVIALALRWNSPTGAGTAVVSIAVLAMGLHRRLNDAATCQVGPAGGPRA